MLSILGLWAFLSLALKLNHQLTGTISVQTQPISLPTAPTGLISISSSLLSHPIPQVTLDSTTPQWSRKNLLQKFTALFYAEEISPLTCANDACVATIAKDVVQKYCPLGKIAVLWYEECMLRYSNQSFLTKRTKFLEFLCGTLGILLSLLALRSCLQKQSMAWWLRLQMHPPVLKSMRQKWQLSLGFSSCTALCSARQTYQAQVVTHVFEELLRNFQVVVLESKGVEHYILVVMFDMKSIHFLQLKLPHLHHRHNLCFFLPHLQEMTESHP